MGVFADNTTALAYVRKRRNDISGFELRSLNSPPLEGGPQCHPSTKVCDGIPQCGSGFVKPPESSDRVRMDVGSGSDGRTSSVVAGEHGPVHDFSELSDSSLLFTDQRSDGGRDDLSAYVFPPFALIREVIRQLQLSRNAYLTLIAPWWPQREWFPDLQELAIEPPVALPLRRDLLHQPHFHRYHLQLHVL